MSRDDLCVQYAKKCLSNLQTWHYDGIVVLLWANLLLVFSATGSAENTGFFGGIEIF